MVVTESDGVGWENSFPTNPLELARQRRRGTCAAARRGNSEANPRIRAIHRAGGSSQAIDHTFKLTWSMAVTPDNASENFGA
jgi:hypothetical protein